MRQQLVACIQLTSKYHKHKKISQLTARCHVAFVNRGEVGYISRFAYVSTLPKVYFDFVTRREQSQKRKRVAMSIKVK